MNEIEHTMEEQTMKKTIVLAMILGLIGFAGEGWAGTTDTITVTVSLGEVISVSLDSGTWTIGSVALSDSSASPTYTATNDGNVAIDLTITGTDATGPGTWTLENAVGTDQFRVTVTSPALNLSTGAQSLATGLAVSGTKAIDMTYYAPSGDTDGSGVAQGFTITVAASKS